MLSYLDRLGKNVLVPLLLRLTLAVVFIFHSMSKLGSEKQWGTNWNPNLPGAVQALVAWGEFLGGVALAIGFLSRLASLGLIVIMVGAIVTVQGQHGFGLHSAPGIDPDKVVPPLGYEFNVVLIVMCACVVLLGSGVLGLDHWLKPKKRVA
jgi:putative oxidoreductase